MMKRQRFFVKCMVIGFLFGVLFAGGVSRLFAAPVRSHAADVREKKVVSVMVEPEDTIWEIADEYYTAECGSLSDYVQEIKRCNSLDSDTIYAGYSLLVPVWVSDTETSLTERDF
jgi:LysM repeat protein